MQENLLKITKILYGVLDFLPDSDPLKTKAKEKALAVLEQGTLLFGKSGWLSLGSYLSADRENMAIKMAQNIEMLSHYLAIGKQQGWVDSMNFFIITKEYQNIKSYISLSGISVKKPLTVTSTPDAAKAKRLNLPPQAGKVIQKIEHHNLRQEKILTILMQKEKLQVRDILKEIPNVTKRTLRRDLDDLLKKGEIIRTGEFNGVFYKKR